MKVALNEGSGNIMLQNAMVTLRRFHKMQLFNSYSGR